MRKSLFLIPVLLAYVLTLGHNLIPHVHHDHSHDTHLHHSNHHDEEEDSEGLNDLFGHILHAPSADALEHILTLAEDEKVLKPVIADLFIAPIIPNGYCFVPELKRAPDPPDRNYSVYFSPYSPLRAPPLA